MAQALAIGRPAYLCCPPGHLEQKFNEDYYFRYFEGCTSPERGGPAGRGQDIDSWADGVSLAEDASLMEQAASLRGWLLRFDEQAERLVIPTVRRMLDESAREAHARRGGSGPYRSNELL